MLFKKGQKVLVRKNLRGDQTYCMENGYGVNSVVSSMERFLGRVVTIERELGENTGYELVEDVEKFTWTDEMLELSNEITIKLKNKEEKEEKEKEVINTDGYPYLLSPFMQRVPQLFVSSNTDLRGATEIRAPQHSLFRRGDR